MIVDTFYKDMKSLFDDKIAVEVYKYQNVSVCNVADYFYAVFPHVKSAEKQCGVIINAEHFRNIVSDVDGTYFSKLYSEMSIEDQKRLSFEVDDKAKELFASLRKETLASGPTSDIDVEFEQSLGVRQVEKGLV